MDRPVSKNRLICIDAMRGLIMALMALDHASFFISKIHSREFWGTTLPPYDGALPFLVRAVTHLCAPGFFLLMGAGMALFIAARVGDGWSSGKITRFFVVRGSLLLLFQQFLENPAWYLGMLGTAAGAFTSRGGPIPGGGGPPNFYLGVLYGLGSAMFVWGLLSRIPTFAVIVISMVAIGSTQVAIHAFADPKEMYPAFVRMILIPGHTGQWLVFYPTIPWMGMAGLGLVLGRWLQRDFARAARGLCTAGAAALVLFVAIRLFEGFGNFHTAAPG